MQQKYEKIGQNFWNMGLFYFERQNTSKDSSFSFAKKFSLNFNFFFFFDICKNNIIWAKTTKGATIMRRC